MTKFFRLFIVDFASTGLGRKPKVLKNCSENFGGSYKGAQAVKTNCFRKFKSITNHNFSL
jgi:hypothetical protein